MSNNRPDNRFRKRLFLRVFTILRAGTTIRAWPMNAITELKEAATWGVTPAMPTTTSETAQSEITQLLREIRDLQKAHFERYLEFTAKIMDAEATRRQDVLRLQIEQLRHQEASRAAAFQRQLLSWIVWAGVVVFCFGGIFLFQRLMAFD